jgi:hypothetical protein
MPPTRDREGTPSLWTDGSQRKLARLYLYTTLPIKTIVHMCSTDFRNEAQSTPDSEGKLEALLEKAPRWSKPQPESSEDMRYLVEEGSVKREVFDDASMADPKQRSSSVNTVQRPRQYGLLGSIEACAEYSTGFACAFVLNRYEASRTGTSITTPDITDARHNLHVEVEFLWQADWKKQLTVRKQSPMSTPSLVDATSMSPSKSLSTAIVAVGIYCVCVGRRYYCQRHHRHQDAILCSWVILGVIVGLLLQLDVEGILLGILPGFVLAAPLSLCFTSSS